MVQQLEQMAAQDPDQQIASIIRVRTLIIGLSTMSGFSRATWKQLIKVVKVGWVKCGAKCGAKCGVGVAGGGRPSKLKPSKPTTTQQSA